MSYSVIADLVRKADEMNAVMETIPSDTTDTPATYYVAVTIAAGTDWGVGTGAVTNSSIALAQMGALHLAIADALGIDIDPGDELSEITARSTLNNVLYSPPTTTAVDY